MTIKDVVGQYQARLMSALLSILKVLRDDGNSISFAALI
jgi:hypothetical protein